MEAVLWHLREELSRSGKVVYVKWFKGRATFFSKELFRALLSVYSRQPRFQALSKEARELLSLLQENIRVSDSPSRQLGHRFGPVVITRHVSGDHS